jgi:hypothetical protein
MGGYWNNPATYTKMALQASQLMKEADPGCRIGALSVAWMDRAFVSKSLEDGLLSKGNIDILTFHGYHRKGLLPESGLASDVTWLRSMARRYRPKGKDVIVVDSERGYAIVPFLEPKHWTVWRTQVYTESEQAAYLARHYLEEIYNGVEISVWYKDMSGEECFSLYYGTDEDTRGLRPMGHVYRNLSALLPCNPKMLRNDRYHISLVYLPDTTSDPNSYLNVKTYLRAYLKDDQSKGQSLIIALWNPIEAFDGRILHSRQRIGDDYYEAWRASSKEDPVNVPVRVNIQPATVKKVSKTYVYDLAAKDDAKRQTPLKLEYLDGKAVTDTLSVGPMPTVIVLEMKP